MSQKENEYTELLAVFVNQYLPAKPPTAPTDLFSSREIQAMIDNHSGVMVPLTEINKLMKDMGYTCQLEDGGFQWECVSE